MSENLYARRETEDQGEHYLKHLDAMTREKLFDKCAIAAELAHRDMEIERLRAALNAMAAPWKRKPIPARDQEHDGHDGHL